MDFLRITKLLALSMICCLAMAACSDDKEESGDQPNNQEEERDPYYLMQYLETMVFVSPNDELREVADVTCVITDYKGVSKTYKLNKSNVIEEYITAEQPDDPNLYGSMTRAPWINLPVTCKAVVNVALKSDFVPDPERDYNLSIRIDAMMTAYNSFGNILAQQKSPYDEAVTITGGDAISEWIGNSFPYQIEFKCEFVNNDFRITKVK